MPAISDGVRRHGRCRRTRRRRRRPGPRPTGGDGTQVVLEAVGHLPVYEQAVGVVRAGGTISRVGVPQCEQAPIGFGSLFDHNITLTGGPAPARAYIETLLPSVLDGTVNPGRVFDLEDPPDAYRAMDAPHLAQGPGPALTRSHGKKKTRAEVP